MLFLLPKAKNVAIDPKIAPERLAAEVAPRFEVVVVVVVVGFLSS